MPEIVNEEMAALWDGAQGDEWVEREDGMNEALSAHSDRLLAAAAVSRDERVLDIGCGTGETTRACAARAVDGRVLGVDLSSAMLERARMRAGDSGLINVEFVRGDAQVYPFEPEWADVVVSRFGVMFFADPVAAFVNIGRAMKPGARLAVVVWQELPCNEWVTVARDALALGRDLPVPAPGTPGPFGLADRQQARGILERAGFGEAAFEDLSLPFSFGANADEAFDFAQGIGIVKGLLDDLAGDQRAEALDTLRTALAAHDSDQGVVFDSRVWLITAVR